MNYPPNYAVPQTGYATIPDPRLPPVNAPTPAPVKPVDEDEAPEDFNAAHKGAAWTGSIVSIIALIVAVVAIILVLFLNPPSAVGRWYTTTVPTSSLGLRADEREVGSSSIGIKNRYIYTVSPTTTNNAIRFSGGSLGDVFGVANTSAISLYIYNGSTPLGFLKGRSGSVLYVYSSGGIAPVRSIQPFEDEVF